MKKRYNWLDSRHKHTHSLKYDWCSKCSLSKKPVCLFSCCSAVFVSLTASRLAHFFDSGKMCMKLNDTKTLTLPLILTVNTFYVKHCQCEKERKMAHFQHLRETKKRQLSWNTQKLVYFWNKIISCIVTMLNGVDGISFYCHFKDARCLENIQATERIWQQTIKTKMKFKFCFIQLKPLVTHRIFLGNGKWVTREYSCCSVRSVLFFVHDSNTPKKCVIYFGRLKKPQSHIQCKCCTQCINISCVVWNLTKCVHMIWALNAAFGAYRSICLAKM